MSAIYPNNKPQQPSLVAQTKHKYTPIKLWSSNKSTITKDEAFDYKLNNPIRRKSSFIVCGLSIQETKHLELHKYNIDYKFFTKFVDALNAALSQVSSWKSLNQVNKTRRKSMYDNVEFYTKKHHVNNPNEMNKNELKLNSGSLKFNEYDSCQVQRAEEIVQWWNKDYFNDKGCNVELKFVEDTRFDYLVPQLALKNK